MKDEKRFDYLEVSGNYKDLGRAIGTKFKDTIQRVVAGRKQKFSDYEEYLKKTEPYFKATSEAFPELIEELEKIAEYAGVSVADCFSLNNREVVRESGNDHCTIGVSFKDGKAVVGHNEDWEGSTSKALYILKATIGETTFFGLQYKVTIPGVSAAVNNWGLTQCINDLDTHPQIGVPKNFVARAILECKTLDEAENLIRNTKRASGFNHVLVQGREVRNIEIAGDAVAVERIMGAPYVHTNHYLSEELKPLEKTHTKSSEERYVRASQLIKNGMTSGDMEMLLSDRKNAEYPIARENATLGSFVAIPQERKVYICYGPPNVGQYKLYDF